MQRIVILCAVLGAIGCGSRGGGDKPCAAGTERCACYGNGTCNAGLECLSQRCVSGAAGGSGGATGAGGGSAGTTGTGAGTGGSALGTAGTSGAGGGGRGGGGSAGSGLAGTTGTAGTIGGAGTLGAAGAIGAGGATADRGGTTGAGGGSAGRGGTTGTGGGAAGTTGTGGVSPCADLAGSDQLCFEAGGVKPGSNPFGISGGVYTFHDGVGSTISPDCQGAPCFSTLNGQDPICVSGTGVRVLGQDFTTYWGAAVALDLNNPANTELGRMPWKASDFGVVGIVAGVVNNDIFSAVPVRMTFKVRDPGNGAILDYCVELGAGVPRAHFTDFLQNCYLSGPGPAMTLAMADHIESIQWQVPPYASAPVMFDFCITGIRPTTN